MGRAGRGGEPSVCIFLHGRNQRLAPEMRPFFKGDKAVCLRRALTNIFTLTDTDGELVIDTTYISSSTTHATQNLAQTRKGKKTSEEYASVEEQVECSEACLQEGHCMCSKCR